MLEPAGCLGNPGQRVCDLDCVYMHVHWSVMGGLRIFHGKWCIINGIGQFIDIRGECPWVACGLATLHVVCHTRACGVTVWQQANGVREQPVCR